MRDRQTDRQRQRKTDRDRQTEREKWGRTKVEGAYLLTLKPFHSFMRGGGGGVSE